MTYYRAFHLSPTPATVGVFATPGNPGFDGYKHVAYNYATCLLEYSEYSRLSHNA
jgi:hypothetical protein